MLEITIFTYIVPEKKWILQHCTYDGHWIPMWILLYDYSKYMCMPYIYVVLNLWLCWPAGWLAKCCTKRCLELVGVSNMLAGLVIVAMHIPICLVFNNSSWPGFYDFTVLEHCFIVSWKACISLPAIVICTGIVMFFVLCLLFSTTIWLFLIFFTNIADSGCLYSGVCCSIFVNVTKYSQWIFSCVRLLCGLIL